MPFKIYNFPHSQDVIPLLCVHEGRGHVARTFDESQTSPAGFDLDFLVLMIFFSKFCLPVMFQNKV